jgi:hypothetical protein
MRLRPLEFGLGHVALILGGQSSSVALGDSYQLSVISYQCGSRPSTIIGYQPDS